MQNRKSMKSHIQMPKFMLKRFENGENKLFYYDVRKQHAVIFAAYLLPTRSLFKKSGHVAGQLTTPKQAFFPQIDVQRRTKKR